MEENTKIDKYNKPIIPENKMEEEKTVTDIKSQNADSTFKRDTKSSDVKIENNDNVRNTWWRKFICIFKDAKNLFVSTYAKRNPFVNGALSAYLFFTIIVAVIDLFLSSLFIGTEILSEIFAYGIIGIFYTFYCVYYMIKFIIANKKNAILPAFMGAFVMWLAIIHFIIAFFTPGIDSNVEEESESFTWVYVLTFVISILFNAVSFGVLKIIMNLKKYGATAWSLLDVSRGKINKYEKVSHYAFFIVWLYPVGMTVYNTYISKYLSEIYASNSTAKVGDYYYADGTVSSEYLYGKKAVGIVFSLETSARDKVRGYNHGQIVSLTDVDPQKYQWNTSVMDIEKYPNYTWKNRLDALKDINGLDYVHCKEATSMTIIRECSNYMQGATKGISEWYVPTAGQWARILENLGEVNIDRMLKFDSVKASTNLEKTGINPKRWYWTITEFDAENAWSIRLSDGEFGSRSNKQNKAYVRPVASF